VYIKLSSDTRTGPTQPSGKEQAEEEPWEVTCREFK